MCLSVNKAFPLLLLMDRITFILSDESVNDYGFRVLTDGIDLGRFLKNPVMLYVHLRGFERNSGDPLLPIGRWDNIRKQNGQLVADAVFDEEDEFSMKVYKKVKKGILNTASIHFDIIELSEDPALMVQGQTMPTITKSVIKEVSIADIPGNANAVKLNYAGVSVKLGLQDSNPEDLKKLFSNHKPNNQSSMKNLIAKLNALKLTAALPESASEAEVMVALDSVINKNQALTDLVKTKDDEINTLKADKVSLETKVADAEKKANEDKAVALIDNAVQAKKITAAQKETYLKLAHADYDATKEMLDGMKGFSGTITSQLKAEKTDSDEDLAAEYDKLHKSGKLSAVKQKDPEYFKQLFNAKFGKDPK